jgi:hypothetical protein
VFAADPSGLPTPAFAADTAVHPEGEFRLVLCPVDSQGPTLRSLLSEDGLAAFPQDLHRALDIPLDLKVGPRERRQAVLDRIAAFSAPLGVQAHLASGCIPEGGVAKLALEVAYAALSNTKAWCATGTTLSSPRHRAWASAIGGLRGLTDDLGVDITIEEQRAEFLTVWGNYLDAAERAADPTWCHENRRRLLKQLGRAPSPVRYPGP